MRTRGITTLNPVVAAAYKLKSATFTLGNPTLLLNPVHQDQPACTPAWFEPRGPAADIPAETAAGPRRPAVRTDVGRMKPVVPAAMAAGKPPSIPVLASGAGALESLPVKEGNNIIRAISFMADRHAIGQTNVPFAAHSEVTLMIIERGIRDIKLRFYASHPLEHISRGLFCQTMVYCKNPAVP